MNHVNPAIFVPVGLVLSAAIALVAYRRGSLSRSGVLGAMLTGTLHFGFGGPTWGLTLIAFFVSSTALGKVREREKEAVAAQYAKGGRRDFLQTVANGGIGVAFAVIYWLYPAPWVFAAFVGALASVAGDTWATEIGVLSRRPPRLITTGRIVPPGTSGGVSPLGTGAIVVGGVFVGAVAAGLAVAFGSGVGTWWVIVVGALAGLAGGLSDSLLGATAQAQYRDAAGTVTEQERGGTRVRGVGWMTNDAVNFCASVVGAVAGGLLSLVFA